MNLDRNLSSLMRSLGLVSAFLLAACATVVPTQLADVRRSLAAARDGQAGKLSPTAVYDAEKAVGQANQEFVDHGNSPALQDFVYIGQRKIDLAEAKARTEADRLAIADAGKQGVVVRDRMIKDGKSALASSIGQLEFERAANTAASGSLKAENAAQGEALAKSDQALVKSEDALAAEKEARRGAEERLSGTMKVLAAFAAVREEARGVVITLSGGVLFASGKAALLPSAQLKLDQVAEALKAQADDKTMIVEGHTDSRGSDGINGPLSRDRATAVRDYLVGRGVDPKKIVAVGMGSSRPILDNLKAENRANNRRVEIVIHSAAVSAG